MAVWIRSIRAWQGFEYRARFAQHGEVVPFGETGMDPAQPRGGTGRCGAEARHRRCDPEQSQPVALTFGDGPCLHQQRVRVVRPARGGGGLAAQALDFGLEKTLVDAALRDQAVAERALGAVGPTRVQPGVGENHQEGMHADRGAARAPAADHGVERVERVRLAAPRPHPEADHLSRDVQIGEAARARDRDSALRPARGLGELDQELAAPHGRAVGIGHAERMADRLGALYRTDDLRAPLFGIPQARERPAEQPAIGCVGILPELRHQPAMCRRVEQLHRLFHVPPRGDEVAGEIGGVAQKPVRLQQQRRLAGARGQRQQLLADARGLPHLALALAVLPQAAQRAEGQRMVADRRAQLARARIGDMNLGRRVASRRHRRGTERQLQMQLAPRQRLVARQFAKQRQRLAQETDRLLVGMGRGGALARGGVMRDRLDPFLAQRRHAFAGPPPVPGKRRMQPEKVVGLRVLEPARLQRRGGAGMHLLASPAQQARIGRVLDQRMAELEYLLAAGAMANQDAGVEQPGERRVGRVARQRRRRRQQRRLKAAAEHRGPQRRLLRGAQRVEPRRQRVAQDRRDARRHRAGAGIGRRRRFEHRPRQLLDEERDAARALQHIRAQVRAKTTLPVDARDQVQPLGMVETVELQQRDVGLRAPGRHEFGTQRHHQQHRQGADARDQRAEQRAGGGIDPMRVLDDHQQTPAARQRLDAPQKQVERRRAALLRRHRRRRRVRIGRQREQACQQMAAARRILAPAAQQRAKLRALCIGIVLATQPRRAAQVLGHRIQRLAGVELRAEEPQLRLRLALQFAAHRVGQPRLADPCLAAQQQRLALAAKRQAPAFADDPQLVRATDEPRQPGAGARLEPPLRAALAGSAPGLHRRRDALDLQRAAIDEVEQPADQPAGRLAHQHAARRRGGVQPRRDIRCLSGDRVRRTPGARDQIADHDQPGMDAHARIEHDARPRRDTPHRRDQIQPGAHGALRVVLARLGIAEIGEHGVADIARDMAARALHDRCCAALIGADHLEHVLGIDPARDGTGTDKIAEQHRHLTPFGLGRHARRRRRRGHRHDRRRAGGWRRHGTGRTRRQSPEQALALAEREPDLAQVAVRQLAQDVEFDMVRRERVVQLVEAVGAKPLPQCRHRASRDPPRRRVAAFPVWKHSVRA